MTTTELHDELRGWMGFVRRRWTRLAFLGAAARGTAGAAVCLAAAALVDRAIRPQGLPLVVLMIASPTLAVAAAALAIWRMPRRPSDRQVARFIEERAALEGHALSDSLVSAVDAAERPVLVQPAFLSLMLEEVVDKLRTLEPSVIVPPQQIHARTLRTIAGAGVLVLALVASLPSFDRALETARLRFFPGSVNVHVQPGDVRIPIGASVRVRASVRGTGGAPTRLAPALTVFAGADRRAVAMTAAADGFEYVIKSVDRTFAYEVNAGSARSSRYTVTAVKPPRVDRIDLHYIYPAFAGLPPRDEQDGGDIYAPMGTRVHLRVHTDKPIARGELALGRSSAVPLHRSDDRTFDAELVLAKDDSYRIRVADSDGLTSRGEAEYFIRLMDDRPPDVRILRPLADQQITPLEEVPIEARADDDYGIERFELVYAVAGGTEHIVPFDRVTGTALQRIGSRLLPAEELHVSPGDVITYYARATDVGRGKRSTEATSDIFFLEVKPFNGEFVAAESQAGAGASDPQIESLIQAQKEIISSTWNVERRSQAARSAEDVKAIAAAQAELKARAEEQLMARTTRRRDQAPAPERRAQTAPQARGNGGDPAMTAVGAMGKAVDQLTSERTKEALTHEMTALNGLLQLQAEVRRQQVLQSTSGASGNGSNRAGQDLSALFDKELQRQQRTNYETRSPAETRPDSPADKTSALDRIRDLAKRQEDLNRRQHELANSNLSADEMKRQLEKLTREQTELREQTEELLRRNTSQRDASGRGGSPGQPSPGDRSAGNGGGGELRDAADQMRSAASDLRRESPGDAARNGERAASQLRRLERQMQSESADAGARGGAGVKLEAQQIAQEQHRIATEAARLERNSGATAADARKRLADEKDHLASRVDDMAGSVEQLAHTASGTEAKALEESARALQQGRVADRMRDTARQMRAGRGPNGSAPEQELAQTLDQVAGRLGAADSPLSNQLEQTRAIRDRLQRAEQQLREAETRAQDPRGRRGSGSSTEGATPGQRDAGSGDPASDVRRLREEYQRELQRAQDALRRLNGASGDMGGSSPEQQEFSRSAPGTEAFKQDRSAWESLRKNVDTALEKYEATISDRLSHATSDERFSAGGSDRVPDAYSQLIARYFESIAKKKN